MRYVYIWVVCKIINRRSLLSSHVRQADDLPNHAGGRHCFTRELHESHPYACDNAMQALRSLRLEAFDEHMLRRVYFPGEIAAYLISARLLFLSFWAIVAVLAVAMRSTLETRSPEANPGSPLRFCTMDRKVRSSCSCRTVWPR